MAGGYDVVLFDFFGTLIGYDSDWAAVGYPRSHELLGRWGHGLAYEAFAAGWGASLDDLERESHESHVEFALSEVAVSFACRQDIGLTSEQSSELTSTFLGEWRAHLRPIAGVDAMLHRLSATCRIGVVSNTNDTDLVPGLLADMGVADVVGMVLLSVDHGYRKPHASIYAEAMRRMGVDAAATAFVGDSYPADFVGPRAAGMAAFLVDPEGRHDVPAYYRLSSVLDVEKRLTTRRRP